jgi:hypothetical protein
MKKFSNAETQNSFLRILEDFQSFKELVRTLLNILFKNL